MLLKSARMFTQAWIHAFGLRWESAWTCWTITSWRLDRIFLRQVIPKILYVYPYSELRLAPAPRHRLSSWWVSDRKMYEVPHSRREILGFAKLKRFRTESTLAEGKVRKGNGCVWVGDWQNARSSELHTEWGGAVVEKAEGISKLISSFPSFWS